VILAVSESTVIDAPDVADEQVTWLMQAYADREAAVDAELEMLVADIEERPTMLSWDAARFAPLTDTGNAEVLAAHLQDALVFDHEQGIWLFFIPSQHCWVAVPDTRIINLAVRVARLRGKVAAEMIATPAPDEDDHSDEAEEARRTRSVGMMLQGFARKSESARSLSATIKVAKSLDELSADGVKWDADAWLLGCPNGVVELKTGIFRPGHPGDRITKQTLLPYDPSAECPRWEQFLEETLPNPEVREWRNRFDGYSCTGDVSYEKSPTDLGPGGNGKSIRRNILRRVMGDYGWNLRADVLLGGRGRHSHETADLEGRRFVTVSELPSDVVVNDEQYKELTSRDGLTAHAKYKSSRTWMPTHHLQKAGNNLMRVKDATDGFWRREVIVKWPVRFADNDALPQELEAELPGTFAWLVRQAIAYAQQGMPAVPAECQSLTSDYREDEDPLAEWAEQRLGAAEGATLEKSVARKDYYDWCVTHRIKHEDRLSTTKFSAAMKARYHEGRPHEGPRYYKDLRLRVAEAVPVPGSTPLALAVEQHLQ